MQPVPVGPSSPAVVMGNAMVMAHAAAPASASAAQAMVVPSVPSVVTATMRLHGTRATSCVLVGGDSAVAAQAVGTGSSPLPVSTLPFLPTECYQACGRCTGPEDSSCLRCKRGWVLHEHRCIGE